MKRIIIFILICLTFGAAMSVAVAWGATLREWDEPGRFAFDDNGWKANLESHPASAIVGAIHASQPKYELYQHGVMGGFEHFNLIPPPKWFPLSTKPANEHSIIRGTGAGWPLFCVSLTQEIDKETFYPEWDFVKSGGLIGTNPFGNRGFYQWEKSHLPLQVVPIGLVVNTLIYGFVFAMVVLALRLIKCTRAKHHQQHKRCPYCKYDLSRATSELCSECGADPQILQPVLSRKTNILTGVVTSILCLALAGFGVTFCSQFPFSKLHYASYHGEINTVRRELESGADIDGSGFEGTYTPLMVACANNQTATAALLIDSGANIKIKSSSQFTALHTAVDNGSVACLSLLLENGADANSEYSKNHDALNIIAYYPDSDLRLLDLILENGYRTEAKEAAIDIAIGAAIRRKHEKFTSRMLELGLVPGYESLRNAVHEGRVDWLESFVKHGSDLGIVSNDGSSIFFDVSPFNNTKEIVEYLVQHGQKIDAARDDGVTPLMITSELLDSDLCQVFLEHGADPNLRDNKGLSALDHAIKMGYGDMGGVVTALLEAGAEPKTVDD